MGPAVVVEEGVEEVGPERDAVGPGEGEEGGHVAE